MRQTTRYALLITLAASFHVTTVLAQSNPATVAGIDSDNGTPAIGEDSIGIQRKDSLSPAQRQARQAELRRSREANGGKLPDAIGGVYSGDASDASPVQDTNAASEALPANRQKQPSQANRAPPPSQ